MSHGYPPSRILAALDFSTLSRNALAYGAGLARAADAELILVHVADPVAPELPPGASPTQGRMMELVEARNVSVRARLTKEMNAFGEDYDTWSALVVDGEPAEAIARVAVERDCHLIVLGSHGRAGLQRLFLGSVAEEVMRRAHCPVLVLR